MYHIWCPTWVCSEPVVVSHLNDFRKDFNSDVLIFADDTSLFKYVKSNIHQAVTTIHKHFHIMDK